MGKPRRNSPQIVKPMALKGFREWLPHEKIVEQRVLDIIRREYEAYGFVPIETAAVERNEVLVSKGGLNTKEIYQLTRLAAETGEANKDRDFSLHFDLTVPFARYTAQNLGKLVFPFKRYQIQKVWRGERPGKGRFREFYQADIDVIGAEKLAISYDAEVLAVVDSIFTKLAVGEFRIRVNNRKLHHGLIEHYALPTAARLQRFRDSIAEVRALTGEQARTEAARVLTERFHLDQEGREAGKLVKWILVEQLETDQIVDLFRQFEAEKVIRYLDDLDKVAPSEIRSELLDKMEIAEPIADALIEFAGLADSGLGQDALIAALKQRCDGPVYQQGIAELQTLVGESIALGVPAEHIAVDPKIARGLNYYTGVIYETDLLSDPDLGSVCSGGRYDNLTSQFTSKRLPGVGISIGVTRLVSSIIEKGLLPTPPATVAAVMLAIAEPPAKAEMLGLARRLRAAGIDCEVSFLDNLSKQMKYAARKGFAKVVVATADELADGQVRLRDMTESQRDRAERTVPLEGLVERLSGYARPTA